MNELEQIHAADGGAYFESDAPEKCAVCGWIVLGGEEVLGVFAHDHQGEPTIVCKCPNCGATDTLFPVQCVGEA